MTAASGAQAAECLSYVGSTLAETTDSGITYVEEIERIVRQAVTAALGPGAACADLRDENLVLIDLTWGRRVATARWLERHEDLLRQEASDQVWPTP